MKTLTKGNVIIEDIQIGDIHYEYEYNICIKSEVISLPILDEMCMYTWQSKSLKDGRIINYAVNTNYPSCYSLNLYDCEAYTVNVYF